MQAVMPEEDKVASLRAGHFLAVRSIVRVLPQGVSAKLVLDAVIDACAAMQNLRRVVADLRNDVLTEAREDKRAKILRLATVR